MYKRKPKNVITVINKYYHYPMIMVISFFIIMAGCCIIVNAADENPDSASNISTKHEAAISKASESNQDSVVHNEDTDKVEVPREADPEENTDEIEVSREADPKENADEVEDEDDDSLDAPVVNGMWKNEAGGWRFYNNDGLMLTGLVTINGNKYYLGLSDGLMKIGFHQLGKYYYYFGVVGDGAMKFGWQRIWNNWYYFYEDGSMSFGFTEINGKQYFFGEPEDGAMKTGWQKNEEFYHYYGLDGAAIKGWQKIGGYWYYFDEMGFMLTGVQKIGGKEYYFGEDNDGAMKTGWQVSGDMVDADDNKIANLWSYLGGPDDGVYKTGWQFIGGYWYYFDEGGVMYTELNYIDDKAYYFGGYEDGRMKTGWQNVDSIWIYLGPDGIARTGWQAVGGRWYYLGEHGEMETGLRNINDNLYFFGEDGAMRTGWQNVESKWYYFNASGEAVKGWQQVGGYWYYLENDHTMVSNTIKEINGSRYAFNSAGVMLAGVFYFNGERYFTNASGAIVNTLNGIDVSEFQSNVDWKRVKAAGIDFAIVRAGYRGKSYGNLVKDSKFEQHISGAITSGIKVGAYMFSEAVNYAEGAEEARYLVSLAKSYDIKLPLVVDTEYQSNARSNGISVAARTDAIKGFCETIQLLGYTPMIYASTSWLNNNLDMSKLNNYKVWVAQYYDRVTYKGNYEFWQYTSKGRVDGINGNVDMNYWYNTKE